MKNYLKELRIEAGLSLQDLGEMTGMSKDLCHQLETNRDVNPTLKTAHKIAAVLATSVDALWPNEVKVVEETKIVRRVVDD